MPLVALHLHVAGLDGAMYGHHSHSLRRHEEVSGVPKVQTVNRIGNASNCIVNREQYLAEAMSPGGSAASAAVLFALTAKDDAQGDIVAAECGASIEFGSRLRVPVPVPVLGPNSASVAARAGPPPRGLAATSEHGTEVRPS